ncbi:MAG: hypothetical protein ABFS08_10250 [Pseudomonadota bacterium]
MKIGEFLYFAPELAFADMDFREGELPDQYCRRIDGYYLAPAEYLIDEKHGFAAGLLVLCAIDALGKIDYPNLGVGERFKLYCQNRLPSFSTENYAKQLYEAFRNGVVHEARAKDGAEISLESDRTVELAPGGIRVNPAYLLNEVREALHGQMEGISANKESLIAFKKYILVQFSKELAGLRTDG